MRLVRAPLALLHLDAVLLDSLVKHIDSSLMKLSSADLALEENIELGESAAFGLGDAEIAVDETAKG